MKLATMSSEPVEHVVVGALRRRWWMGGIVWVATMAATIVFTWQQAPVYRANTSLVVVPHAGVEGAADVLRSLDTLDRRTIIATFARLPSTSETRTAAAAVLGVPPATIADYRVTAGVVPSTNIIRIEVEGADPARAADVSNALAQVVGTDAPQLYRIFSVQVIERAVPSRRPVSPDMRRNLVAGAIAGLLLGAAAAAAADYLRRRTARA